MESIRKIFNKVYNNQKNCITPTILKYGEINQSLIYELSKGRGIFNNYIFGNDYIRKK